MPTERDASRRRFLSRAAILGGAAMLPKMAAAEGAKKEETAVVQLPENQALQKVGGAVVIEALDDKIIIARTGETSYVACSAVCTHRGCVVNYQHESAQFLCPCHQARFALDGKVLRGPARKPLREYSVGAAVVVERGADVEKKKG